MNHSELVLAACLLLMVLAATAPAAAGDTAFSYGGYFKLDVLSTYYRDGDVASGSPLRDFHLPSQIPVGETDENYDLDFAGAAEGIVFGRQPQIRWSPGPWRISLENPETTVSIDDDGSPVSVVTESGRLPDLVVHREFAGDWGSLGVALIGRQLYYKGPDVTDPTRTVDDPEFGFGLSAGTRIKIGQRDEVLVQATAGQGLGRYTALNYVNSAALDDEGKLHTIDLVCGFVGYRHWWSEAWRSSLNISLFAANNPASVTGGGVNREAQSYSINLLYSPIPKLTFGAELMHARRVLENGTDGAFDRLQLSARYDFGYSSDQDVRKKGSPN